MPNPVEVVAAHTDPISQPVGLASKQNKTESEFCTPGEGQEKGGVEGEVGYFRRNHWVPVPQALDLADLNRQLVAK